MSQSVKHTHSSLTIVFLNGRISVPGCVKHTFLSLESLRAKVQIVGRICMFTFKNGRSMRRSRPHSFHEIYEI